MAQSAETSLQNAITRIIRENTGGARPVSSATEIVGDMSRKEVEGYSVCRAINGLLNQDMSKAPLERDVSKACEGAGFTRTSPHSVLYPTHMPYFVRGAMGRSRFQTRAEYQVGTPSQGGNLVETELRAGSFIEVLRNTSVTGQLGATFLPGLVGDINIPRQNSQTQTYWVGESSALTEGEATFDQVQLRPHVVGALSKMSRLMVQQSTPAIEQLVRDELLDVTALTIDAAALTGLGTSGQPTGIANTSNVGSVVMGTNGANLTFDAMVQLYAAPLVANAPQENLAFAINGKTKGYLSTLKSTTGQYLWNPTQSIAGSLPDTILGYRYAVSNQLPYNLSKGVPSGATVWNSTTSYTVGAYVTYGASVYQCATANTNVTPGTSASWTAVPGAAGNCSMAMFGNWKELLIGEWGVVEITVNPFDSTGFATGDVLVRSFATVDVGIRHPQSFCVVSDALTPGF